MRVSTLEQVEVLLNLADEMDKAVRPVMASVLRVAAKSIKDYDFIKRQQRRDAKAGRGVIAKRQPDGDAHDDLYSGGIDGDSLPAA